MENEIATPSLVTEFQQSHGVKLVVTHDLLTITVDAGMLEHSQWREFVSGCHWLAGELGCGIEFETC